MKMTRRDLEILISISILVLGPVTAITGLASDLWGLHDFFYHKYTGYVAAVLALVHVYLHWSRLVAYVRRRLSRHLDVGASPVQVPARPAPEERQFWQSPPIWHKLKSRRGFIGLMLGAVGGMALERVLHPQPEILEGSDLGQIYHRWSKPGLRDLLGPVVDWGNQPELYKEYPQRERYDLPPPGDLSGLYTEETIRRRRSVRDYGDQFMTQEELSRLLFYTGGINVERWGHRLRAAPSAGALYPIEVYPIIHRVEGLTPGLYHYNVADHSLSLLQDDDLKGAISRHGLTQEFLGQANLVLVLTAIFQRLRWKYQERSYRYALLEAGHLGQNVYLAATSMGLGACAVGAFLDDGLNAMLGVDGVEEAAIYMLSVGKL
jgi:SagB-type dehydrogenase family enzyme